MTEGVAEGVMVLGWQFWAVLIMLLTAGGGVVMWAVKTIMDSEFGKFETLVQASREENRRVEEGLNTLRVELAQHYVRREDWIRFSAIIDAKQDALRESSHAVSAKLDMLMVKVNQLEKASESRHAS